MDAVEQLRKANPSFLNHSEGVVQETVDVPEEIQRIWSHFKRYVDLNDRRIENLKQEVAMRDKMLKEAYDFVQKIKDRETVQQTRERVFQMQNSPGREPATQPIDRNGVAPSEVKLDKIFYTGRGR